MKICTCTSCRYTFRYPIVPSACPDCGRQTVRLASSREIEEFLHNQKILAKEIKLGLYPPSMQSV